MRDADAREDACVIAAAVAGTVRLVVEPAASIKRNAPVSPLAVAVVAAQVLVVQARALDALVGSKACKLLEAAAKIKTRLLLEELRACNLIRVAHTVGDGCVPRAACSLAAVLVIVGLAGLGTACVGVVFPGACLEGAGLLVKLGLRAVTVAGIVNSGG